MESDYTNTSYLPEIKLFPEKSGQLRRKKKLPLEICLVKEKNVICHLLLRKVIEMEIT